ncbi:TetR/AcrR family transcriptional regulator [Aureisphaera galaxeae]|uniref:TetR/AcrR family transcriptional regulator n=1 Tax=Aureisphaera galaxeae TaxID=1538023 RepID=UPI0023500ABC|nr:TetR/AcrR family transcriptional regulator [Aureisphaera galaxeae]MDC8005245.1 TetR/AcrR family transcriptional regulator [Aureisphaera galaxeae]
MGYKHNKEDILETGFHVLRKNGYHGVGINEILKEAGIPKGSFYNFFDSKEDFAKQVMEHHGTDQGNWIVQFFEQANETPLTNLKAFYKTLIAINETDGYSSGCLINVMSNEVGRTNDTLAVCANDCFLGWINIISREIEKGQESGEIRKDFSALEIAEYLHSGIYGAFSRMKVTRSRVYLDIWWDMSFTFIQES